MTQRKKLDGNVVAQFLDNSDTNCVGMSKIGVKCIVIDDTEPNPRSGYPYNSYFDNYYSQLNQQEKKIIERIHHKYPLYGVFSERDTIISNGLTTKDIMGLLNRCFRHLKQNKSIVLFFDWDLTLTIREGIHLLRLTPSERYEYMKYVFGGQQRLTMISKLFELLKNIGVQVYILTNNTGAIQNPYIFLSYVQVIDPSFKQSHIMASGKTRSNINQGQSNKKVYLRQTQSIWKKPSSLSISLTQVEKKIHKFIKLIS